MTVLVDEAVWPWRGDRWAHLVSDESIEELHEFASRLGLRRMSFQGDHYDVRASTREEAVLMGAEEVVGRDLVRRLRASGLRLAAGARPGRWERVAAWPPAGLMPDVAGCVPMPIVDALAACVVADWATAAATAYRRTGQAALVVEGPGGLGLVGSPPGPVEASCDGGRLVEMLAPTGAHGQSGHGVGSLR